MGYHCAPFRMAKLKNWPHQVLMRMCRNWTIPNTASGDAKWHNHSGKQFPKNINIWSRHSILICSPKRNESFLMSFQRFVHKPLLFIAALFVIAPNCKQLKCPYHPSVTRNKFLALNNAQHGWVLK